MNKREFLKITTKSLIGANLVSISALTSGCMTIEKSNDQLSDTEMWMNSWMGDKKAVGGSLHVFRFRDPFYVLTKPISWKPNPGQESFEPVTVPKGFVTDFASIPRPFWSLLRPDGYYTYPAIVHDYLYWSQERTREESDSIFRFGMIDFDIKKTTINAIYRAVRIGGGNAWSDNAALKAKGERRILRKFPQDPIITWDTWKKIDGVFD